VELDAATTAVTNAQTHLVNVETHRDEISAELATYTDDTTIAETAMVNLTNEVNDAQADLDTVATAIVDAGGAAPDPIRRRGK
jgi:uncharacterized protein (DUF3084 family)